MPDFSWEKYQKTHTKEQYGYLHHVYVKNIQEIDFVRGYRSLRTPNGKKLDSKKTASLYRYLKHSFNFFEVPK